MLTVTPGWSEAYGLFTKGEAPMVLSYTTSPAYHMIAENTDRYQAAAFSEGHYIQIEVAGHDQERRATSRSPGNSCSSWSARPSRTSFPTTNWMFPAGSHREPCPAFDKLVQPQKTFLIRPQDVAANRKAWIDEWLAAMSAN